MKFFKWLKKHWFNLVNLLLIAIMVAYIPIAIKRARDYEIYKEPAINTKIYTVWHIETFEGGGKSRLTFLNKIARQIETENAGVLVMVRTISPEKLQAELEQNKPDVVSFGYGVGKVLAPTLCQIDSTFDVRDELVSSGSLAGKIYALPYMVSGYAFFSHGGQVNNFYCGQNEYINPSKIFKESNLAPAKMETQYEAYKDFVYDSKSKLLGSARDVFRVSNLNNVGRISASIEPVDAYTDLVQYLALTNTDEICKNFLSLALSNSYQNSLVDYGLFSSKYPKIYASGIYNDMENALLIATVPNAFE